MLGTDKTFVGLTVILLLFEPVPLGVGSIQRSLLWRGMSTQGMVIKVGMTTGRVDFPSKLVLPVTQQGED